MSFQSLGLAAAVLALAASLFLSRKPELLRQSRFHILKFRLRLQYLFIKLRYARRIFSICCLQFTCQQGTRVLKAMIATLNFIADLRERDSRCARYLGLFLDRIWHIFGLEWLAQCWIRSHQKNKNRPPKQ